MNLDTVLVAECEAYVKTLYAVRIDEWRSFHNIEHTVGVVKACEELSQFYQLPKSDHTRLIMAAWLHDTGYCKGTEDHETESIKIATAWLMSMNVDVELISTINSLILSTIHFNIPTSILEKILCDADMYHLSLDNYNSWSLRLKLEIENDMQVAMSAQQWRDSNIQFFKKHRYHTDYAKAQWGPAKQKNFERLFNQT